MRKKSAGLPIPFGWFAVEYSDALQPGEVRPYEYFDDEFVVWRGEDNAVRALPAHCRHLGAHLGHGGVVVGNDLRCPFHNWSYDGTGAVTDIPYSPGVPPGLRTPCPTPRPVAESNGVIYIWHHPNGEAPLWEVASIPEIQSGDWMEIERRDWVIPIHVQEITENGIDYAHFPVIHGTKSPPEPEWTIEGYRRESFVTTKMETPRGLVDGSIHVRNTGPGQSFVRFSGISDMLLANLPTPIDENRSHLRQVFFIPRNASEGAQRASRAVARNVIFQLEQDIPIWTHKRYVANPPLVRGDGPIRVYRRNYAQYYVGASATESDADTDAGVLEVKPQHVGE